MQMTMQDLAHEGLDGLIQARDPLAEIIYRLYMIPRAARPSGPRVVIRRRCEAGRGETADPANLADVAAFFDRCLVAEGRRVGEVIFDVRPQPEDYVLEFDGREYCLHPPARGQRKYLDTAPIPMSDGGSVSACKGFSVEISR